MPQTLPMQMHDEQAVRWQKKAIQIVPEQQEALNRDRLEGCKQGKPFRVRFLLGSQAAHWGDWKELGGLVSSRHLLLVHGVSDGLHQRPTVDIMGGQLKDSFKAAGTPSHTDLKWENSGHWFYPDKMWSVIE